MTGDWLHRAAAAWAELLREEYPDLIIEVTVPDREASPDSK